MIPVLLAVTVLLVWVTSLGATYVRLLDVAQTAARQAARGVDTASLPGIVVELDEGPRLVSGIVDCPPEELVMEMPVEVVFEHSDRLGERMLPRFRRTAPATASARAAGGAR